MIILAFIATVALVHDANLRFMQKYASRCTSAVAISVIVKACEMLLHLLRGLGENTFIWN